MKHLLTLLLSLSFLLVACERDRIQEDDSPAPYTSADNLFNDKKLPQLQVSVSESEWNRLLRMYDEENHNHSYIKCSKVIFYRGYDTFSCDNVGLRLRGQTSRRRPEGYNGQSHKSENAKWRHVHFGLNCRAYSDSGSFAGVRRINLKYAKEDPSYIREHYCFDMLSRFGVWTAPKSSWCRLSFNIGNDDPVYYGVYLMIESIDKQYVKRRPGFGPAEGWLWKCGWGANLRDTDEWRFHFDDNSPNTYSYDLKADDPDEFEPAKEQLRDFITKLNKLSGIEFYNWIYKVCDVDLLLKMYAGLVALGHWDDYWNNMNNFYLYFNNKDPENYKVYMLPYDLDNTLGTSTNCGVQNDSGRQDPYNWGVQECVLLYKLLKDNDIKNKYTSYLCEFATTGNAFTGQAESAARIRAWQEMLERFVSNDTGEDMVIKDAPASWGNHPEYRLLEDSPDNWFKVKAESIAYWINKQP